MYRQGVEPSTHAFGLVGLLGKHDLLWQMPSYKLMNMTKGQVLVSIVDMNIHARLGADLFVVRAKEV